ncbi:ARMT1-like domain-containing protein [Vibrio sp. JC009]|uniref:damage-control phosphatase ARMT1 family protein n=1 Tax=Vibrio sp. JC009 TaxID=2912314 RepID=UPI0023AF617A|nr:ARMT1-like domain-containing protein [Vibrio sp. JC009]WED23819.1 ARMT1-like domain-containing protein [Vibrio sp. JC009]
MRSSLDCIPCFMRQALEAGRRITNDEQLLGEALRRISRSVADFDMSLSPPEMGQKIHRILREEVGCDDPYLQIKKDSNQMALSLVPQVSNLLELSENPFELALRFAIAGNILDFALLSVWDDNRIIDSFDKASKHPVDTGMVEQLKQKLEKAENVLILADNAGETVFDRFLIEQLPPHLKVTYAVKGSPVINDAVAADATEAGIDQLASVIDNGTDAPGTVLDQCSPSFRAVYDSADVVIAKGQANFETLNTADREIFFLTQIKCAVIARAYDYEVGDWIVTTTTELAKSTGESV